MDVFGIAFAPKGIFSAEDTTLGKGEVWGLRAPKLEADCDDLRLGIIGRRRFDVTAKVFGFLLDVERLPPRGGLEELVLESRSRLDAIIGVGGISRRPGTLYLGCLASDGVCSC